ncbi:hypothetical protein QE177_14920 (plasmid) [Arsenophonus sp. aPb]|uniref:hypothetical protein n=1 Tax=Arsenophonus sp. aPb TaxID=3041619 RepID=UPI00246933BC|nr:hypothetical protein [Arsenophonus sp. aPb]WGL99874.1 hypothetical protein QE177_14920 [Arsenophonus sp. aPb]
MRALLIKTGTPQNNQWNSNHIGPLPNVRNAIEELQRRLQLPTDYPLWDIAKLYMAGDKVSWKNKKWIAISNNQGWEPGNLEFWREIL